MVGRDLVLSAFSDAVRVSRARLHAANRPVVLVIRADWGWEGTAIDIKFGECVFNDLFVRWNYRKLWLVVFQSSPSWGASITVVSKKVVRFVRT